jgi:cold shock CspA family protein
MTDIEANTEYLMGCVKWFNTKDGYGFINIISGTNSGIDVFVHHSCIIVSNQQYKYLVQGEYVEFKLITTDFGKHKLQAGYVSGIKGGKLMCETRFETKHIKHEDVEHLKSNDTVFYSEVDSNDIAFKTYTHPKPIKTIKTIPKYKSCTSNK